MEDYEGMNISEIIDEIQQKEKRDTEKTLVLMSNANYIHWIDEYVEINDGFSDDDIISFSNDISLENKEQIKLLPLFYRGISNYAGRHYIYSKFCESGEYYKVKYNDIGLEIGTIKGENTSHFCNKIIIDDEKSFIDFKDILLENKQERADQIKENLNNIANSIISAYENGVPLKSIENTLYSSIKKVKSKHKEKRYK